MQAIAAVEYNNWGIGKDGNLLARIPEDMQFFREMTLGKVVVMGRKTLESFPDGKPLPYRTNIVLTSDSKYKEKNPNAEQCIVVHSLEKLKKELEKYPTEDVFVIGGGQIYNLLIKDCSIAYITKLYGHFEADTFFPNLDNLNWKVARKEYRGTYKGIGYEFCTYMNNYS